MNWDERFNNLSKKHGFDIEAIKALADGMKSAGGRLARFDHPGLGGMGQWMPGYTKIGANDPALKERVNGLCEDLLRLLKSDGHPHTPGTDEQPPGFAGQAEEKGEDDAVWWPKTLGTSPNSVGGQNQVRYAYFADARRLAVDRGDGRVTVYDTGEHHVHGVAQRQGGSAFSSDRLVFQSQHGEVDLDTLTIVEPPGD